MTRETAGTITLDADALEFPVGSITRELLVGASGAVLVLFIVAHLAGNFFLFAGPAAYNAYAEHLHSLGALLWIARLGLITAFVVHVGLTMWLALDNRAARKTRYAVRATTRETNFAKSTMLYTGLLVLTFLVLHIADFALADPTGARSVIHGLNNDESLGLYGLVWNTFANPLHALFYIAALCAVGLHLSNAVSTVWVTFGALTDTATGKVKFVARAVGALVALAFSSIPLYVLVTTYLTLPHH